MDRMNSLRQLIDDYIEFSTRLRKEHSTLRSLFGPRTEEIEHPGHQEFDAAVENWTRGFAASAPSQETLMAGLELLLFSARAQEGQPPYWYLTAIQRHSMMLIPLLEEGSRAVLAERFVGEYPPKRQVPSQTEIHKMLDPAAGNRKPFFRRKR